MAAGIGEASAIATFLQVGLSIATTLNTYISDVRDAPTEVCDLANEITSTLWQVDVLNDLIASNDPSNGWSAKGVVFAQKSLAESEKIIKKILTLLQKAGSNSNTTKVVTLDSIDLSLFTQLRWPTFKPQLEKVKRRLECIRMDICLLCGMHKAISGATKQERDTASEAVVKFAQSRATAKAVLRKVTAMQKGNVGEPQSPPPSRVRFSVPAERASRRKTRSYKIDMGEDTEPLTLSGKDPEDVHIQFTSLTAAIREMITDEHQAEETARKKAAEEKQTHEREVLEEYKRGLVEKYTDLERKAATLREQLKRGFEPELPDEQIDSHIKRLQAKELSNDEILKRIADFGFRQTESVEIESDQTTLVSTSNRPESGRLWSQLRRSLKDGDRNPIPMALRQNHSIPGLAKVTSISLSFDGEEWHVVQVNVSMPWLINRLAAEEKRDSRSIGKINETLKAYSKLPRECRFAAEAWLLAAGNRKYAWALLYAHTTKTSVSKPRKMLQKAVFGSAIEAQVDNVILVYRATRDSQGHSYDDRKADEDAEGEAEPAKVTADDSATTIPPTELPPDSPATQASAPRSTADPKRGPEGPNPFSNAYQNLPPPPPHTGPYPQLYPYPSPMGRPPPPYAGMPPPPNSSYSPFSSYPPYTDGTAYDPFASQHYPHYPTYDPFRPSAYDQYAYNPYFTPASPPPAPAPPRHSPPTSKGRPSSYSYSAPPPPVPYRDRSEVNADRRHTIYKPPSAPSRPTDTYSASRANRSVVIHDPRSQPAYSSDEWGKGNPFSSRRASSRRTSSRRDAYDDYRRPSTSRSRRPSPSPSYSSDEFWPERKPAQVEDFDSDESRLPAPRPIVHRVNSSRPTRRSVAASDSGYSSHRTREDATHQPPNWVLYRANSAANRSSSPEISDDSSNLSVDAKTLKEDELRNHLLSKYTNSEVGSSRVAPDGPRIEEVLSENGDGVKQKDVEEVVEVIEEEDPWSSWGVSKKERKKKDKKTKVNGINGSKDGEAPQPVGDDDGWGAFTSVGKKKKGKKVKVNGIDEIVPPPPPPPLEPEVDPLGSHATNAKNAGDGEDESTGMEGTDDAPENGDK